jgi:serine/threonine-protein kinase
MSPSENSVALLDALRDAHLLSAEQLESVRSQPEASPQQLARELVQRGWLTSYQVRKILQGRDPNLGPYTLLDKIGEGAMGKVYKARHRQRGDLVALKVIRAEKLESESSIRRFFREIEAVAQLDHPNVVRAYDSGEAGDRRFYAMEYVDGTSLARLVQQTGPLPVEQACDYLFQAALGLEHAHQHGLVHRDIKPENFLVSRDGVVKLLDLGLARLSEPAPGAASSSLTRAGTIVGTPDFIAPEQARNSHTVDIRADLYSLGCTFYYLLVGHVPFPGGNPLDKLVRHHQEESVPVEQLRPEVPAAVSAVVRKLMAKKPSDRFQTPADLADALRPLVPRAAALRAAVIRRHDEIVADQTDTADTVTPSGCLTRPEIGMPARPVSRLFWIVCGLAILGAVLAGLLYALQP